MRSKTSLFHKTLFVNDIKKSFPLMLGLLFSYAVAVLYPGLIGQDHGAEGISVFHAIMWLTNPILIAMLSMAFALIGFHYLYRRRDSYMLHSFPVSRMAHVVSHMLSGLTMLTGTLLVAYLLTLLLRMSETDSSGIPLAMVFSLVEVLFFYGLSVFVIIICGNVVLAIATYGVLNLLWAFLYLFAGLLQEVIRWDLIVEHSTNLFGFMDEGVDGLFPVGFFLRRWWNEGITTSSTLECMWMLIPAVIFMGLGILLYCKRPLEKTGAMVAFDWCKVVFRVLFTVCGAGLLMGVVLVIGWSGMRIPPQGAMLAILLTILLGLGGLIGFFVSEMLLKKDVRVFRGKKPPILQFLIPMGVIAAYAVLLGAGVIGTKALPDSEDIAVVRIYDHPDDVQYGFYDKNTCDKALDIFRELLEDKELRDKIREQYEENGGLVNPVQVFFGVNGAGESGLTFGQVSDTDGPNPVMKKLFPLIRDPQNAVEAVFGTEPESWVPRGVSVSYSEGEEKSADDIDKHAFYMALLQDMREGNVLPYRRELAEKYADERAGSIVCDVCLNMSRGYEDQKTSKWMDPTGDIVVRVALTGEARRTLEFLCE